MESSITCGANQNHVFVFKPQNVPVNISEPLVTYKLIEKIMAINEIKCHI